MNEAWTIRNRTAWFWHTVRTSQRKWKVGTLWHNIVGPSTGCSCTFCFISKRRKFPPGHPMHPVQLQASLERKLDEHIRRVRIRDENRPHPFEGPVKTVLIEPMVRDEIVKEVLLEVEKRQRNRDSLS